MPITLLHMKMDLDRDTRWALSGVGDKNRAEAARTALEAELYVAVAEIDTEDLDRAYMLTQNGIVSDSWFLDPPPGVRPLGDAHTGPGGQKLGHKSTEMGDVMIKDGKAFVVDIFGFAEIEGWEPPAAPKP